MISEEKLKEICDKYGIDFEKLIKTNNNVLKYGEYREICDTLDYLRDEVKILSRNIEKCPSILYFSTKNIRDNWEFLKGKEIAISNVENCLHILNTDGSQMRETYQYVIDNYGIRYLNAITSILRVPTSRIKEIERRFQDRFKPKNFLQAACSRFSIEEIEKIVKVCEAHNIKLTGSIFLKSAKQIKENIEYIKENYGEEFLKPLIISKSKKVLEETLPYFQKKGVLRIIKNSASILSLKLSEIQDREAFIEKIGESIVRLDGKAFNSIFGLSRKKYEERKKQHTLSANDIGKASYVSKVEECDKADEVIGALVRENERVKDNNIKD